MRVAYIAEWDFSKPSGVSQKILSQMRHWKKLGLEVTFFNITPREASDQTTWQRYELEGLHFTSIAASLGRGGAATYANKVFSSHRLEKSVRDFKPNLIYYRLGIWYPGLERTLSLAPYIVELNSLELNELRDAHLIKKLIYRLGRRPLLENAIGFVATSNEIANDINTPRKPTLVSANGTDFPQSLASPRKIISARPQGLFVGSRGQFWNGVDLIVALAIRLPELDFHLVGIDPIPGPSNVRYHGNLFHEELSDLASGMDFGIGTLALGRKGMREASPLKTRDYGAWGLPIIYAYDDTDLPDSLAFALKLSCNEKELLDEASRIRDFAFKWNHQEHEPKRFQPYFDARKKEERRVAFFKDLLEEGSSG